ncbi:MAG: T9SS type A sorting domain-containing protein [Ginsengibacter sp.]
MRNFYFRMLHLFFACIFLNVSFAQQTAHPNVVINNEIHGYYVALPDDYNTTSTKYPLLIVLQGYSQMGEGTAMELPYLLGGYGTPPWRLNQVPPNNFPSSFTIGSGTYKFIVFTPQFRIPTTYGSQFGNPYLLDSANGFPGTDITDVINYCNNNYRVDKDRVYLSGNSLGGAQAWSYLFSSQANAKKIAGAVIISGASVPTKARAAVIASGNVAVLATSASLDDGIPPEWTINWIDSINNNIPAPLITARKIIFDVPFPDHSIASINTYNPGVGYDLIDGLNMFEWLLLSRANPLPVSGIDLSVVLKNSEFTIVWSTKTEINNKGFYVETSANGIDFKSLEFIPSKGNSNIGFTYAISYQHPIQGKNYFRLKQINRDNTFVYSDIKVAEYRIPRTLNVYPNPVKDLLTLKTSFQFTNAHLEIKDMNGKAVKVQSFSGDNASISVNELSKGVYHGTIVQDEEVYSFTFVKQ